MDDELKVVSCSTNENFTLESNTSFGLAQDEIKSFILKNDTEIVTLVITTDYTIDRATGVVTGVSASDYNATAVQAIYTHNYEGWASNATQDGLNATAEIGSWLDLIVIIFIAAIIIGLVSVFGLSGRRRR